MLAAAARQGVIRHMPVLSLESLCQSIAAYSSTAFRGEPAVALLPGLAGGRNCLSNHTCDTVKNATWHDRHGVDMRMIWKRKAAAILFVSEILAWGAFSARQASRSLAPAMILLAGVIAVSTVVCWTPRWTSSRASAFSPWKLALALTPSWLLFIDFIPSKILLRDISPLLFILSVTGSFYLLAVSGRPSLPKPLFRWDHSGPPAKAPPKRRNVRLVFFISLAVYTAMLFSGFVPALPFSGDEPHYLLMARSIVRDGDLNLHEDYGQQHYREFYPGSLDAHAYPGKKGPGRLYSKHMPALPLLLAPAYWCGEKLEASFPSLKAGAHPDRNIKILMARETMAVLAALLATSFFVLVWEVWGSRSVAICSWIFFAFSLPLAVYARLLYPEIPAALILLMVLSRPVSGKAASSRSLAWTGLGISLLPWFGIKYVILAAAAFLVVLADAWASQPRRKSEILHLLAPALVSGALFSAYLMHSYGSISPFVVYHGLSQVPVTPVIHGLRFQPVTFFSTGLAYFLDQRIGLFVYSPLAILFVPGVILWFRKRKSGRAALCFVAAVSWAFFALINLRQGHQPPGRELLPVLPILALFATGAFAWGKSRAAIVLARVLAVFAGLVTFLGIRQPWLLFHTGLSSETWNMDTQANLLAHFSNAGFDFTRWLPNLIFLPDFSPIALVLCLAALAAASIAVVKTKPVADRHSPLGGLAGHLAGVFILSLFLVTYRAVDVRLDSQQSMLVRGATVFFQDNNVFGGKEDGFWTKGNSRTAVVYSTSTPLNRLHLHLSSPVPLDVSLQVGRRRFLAHSSFAGRFQAVLEIPASEGRRWKRNCLYRIAFRVAGGFIPATQGLGSTDWRYLGVFVRLSAE